MKLINKSTNEIRTHKRYARFAPFVSFLSSEKNVSFPGSTVELAQLRVGSYIHFVEIGPKCFGFICNNKPDGFKLITNSKSCHGLRVCCGAFVSLFKSELGLKKGSVSFYVQKHEAELNGCTLFEILSYKSRDVIKKRNDK